MKYAFVILLSLGALLMLYNQVRMQGIVNVCRTALPIIILCNAAWLWGAKDVVLFKRSKSQDAKSNSNSD
jgi:hypothetical protein